MSADLIVSVIVPDDSSRGAPLEESVLPTMSLKCDVVPVFEAAEEESTVASGVPLRGRRSNEEVPRRAPADARLIADVTSQALARIESGGAAAAWLNETYHLAPKGETSWYGYARFIVEELRVLGHPTQVAPDRILPIPTSAYQLPARRPHNSRLNTSMIESWLGVTLPPSQTDVRRVVREMVSEMAT